MSTDEKQSLSRRHFILSVLSGLAAVKLAGCGSLPESNPLALRLSQTIGDADATSYFGRLYLERYPEEAEIERLLERIDKELIGEFSQGMHSDKPQLLAEHLDKQVRSDYRRGEVVRVDDWLLSRTEARIYACFVLL
jgi:hypothetical protein